MTHERSAHTQLPASPGVRYVEAYLSPRILARPAWRGRRLSCVVIAPADATYDYQGKATGFRQAGHECDVIRMPCDDPAHEASPPFALPLASDRYDLVELGEFGRIAVGHERRSAFVRELLRICKPDGVVVAPLGNRLCPLNLSGGRLAIHGPWARTLLGFAQAEALFVGPGRFSSMRRLNVAGHFGWSRLRGPGRLAGRVLDAFWTRLATPERSWLYDSPLNPVGVFWIEK